MAIGRPEIDLDWKKIDFLLEAGCPGTEVASHMGCHFETLYDRVEKKYGMPFSQYSYERRQKGDSSIRAKQYQKALQGDNHMLIWLGKNRLKQKDREDVAANEPTKVVFEVNYGNGNQVEILPQTLPTPHTPSS
jgi:hypothetical protein